MTNKARYSVLLLTKYSNGRFSISCSFELVCVFVELTDWKLSKFYGLFLYMPHSERGSHSALEAAFSSGLSCNSRRWLVFVLFFCVYNNNNMKTLSERRTKKFMLFLYKQCELTGILTLILLTWRIRWYDELLIMPADGRWDLTRVLSVKIGFITNLINHLLLLY
jgi:hypothetical protein